MHVRLTPMVNNILHTLSKFPSNTHGRPSLLFASSNTFSSPIGDHRSVIESRFISHIDVCTSFAHLKTVHARILRVGLEQSSFVVAKLVRAITKLGLPIEPYARRIFDQVLHPNPFLWTSLIRAYAHHGPHSQSLLLYSHMRCLHSRPLSFTFSSLLKSCSSALDFDAGRQIHAQTISLGGFESDLYVNNTLIDFYVKCGCLADARKVFDEMPEKDVISWTSLIVAYTRQGEMDAAQWLFERLEEKDMVVWTAMITGYAQNARPREAIALFERMHELRVQTDEVTLVGAISACAQLGAANNARWIQDVADQAGFGYSMNVVVGSALIDMYAKCGNVEAAHRVFKGMNDRNVYSYSAMIVGFATHGKADRAIGLFQEMVSTTNVKPNGVTFIGVLTACSHAGLVDEGRYYFASMQDVYRVTPSADHYACMVDLLGRGGHVEEAHDLIRTMPMEPHGGVWGALLGACRIHGNPHVAKVAAQHLFKLEPNAIGNYVLLCNIYASAGMWDEVTKLRKLMREKGLRKNPGCSWVAMKDGVVHEFFAGDTSHPEFHAMKEILEDLLIRLKRAGYSPKLNSVVYDVNDEEKERLLKMHSEKLALAFGLLAEGTEKNVIQIVKNLRMCEDCHLFMRGASLMTKREIVVRDNMRFHHFHNGVCSCGEFW